ncbi:hypothetical protein V5O48_006991 [Marasmius crinis-equi]|uniref:Uncharacterized protein n=1 Tax=Marasmius crinis-equi TaxID=585013 RepID=A0ABR3FHX2_9AGAR
MSRTSYNQPNRHENDPLNLIRHQQQDALAHLLQQDAVNPDANVNKPAHLSNTQLNMLASPSTAGDRADRDSTERAWAGQMGNQEKK